MTWANSKYLKRVRKHKEKLERERKFKKEVESFKEEARSRYSLQEVKEKIGEIDNRIKLKLLNLVLNNNPVYKGGIRGLANALGHSTSTIHAKLEELEEDYLVGNFNLGNESKIIIPFVRPIRKKLKNQVQNKLYPKDLTTWVSKTQNQDDGRESLDYLPEGFGLVKNQAEVNGKTYTYWKLAKWNSGKNHSPKYLKSLGNVEKVTKKEAREKAIKFLKTTWVSKKHLNWVSKNSPTPPRNNKRLADWGERTPQLGN